MYVGLCHYVTRLVATDDKEGNNNKIYTHNRRINHSKNAAIPLLMQ